MITQMTINGTQVFLYSVGQLAARMRRVAGSVRRLERQGVIPQPKYRSAKQYRLYTNHECDAIEYVFKTLNVRKGIQIDVSVAPTLQKLFGAIHAHYANPKNQLPQEVGKPNHAKVVNIEEDHQASKESAAPA